MQVERDGDVEWRPGEYKVRPVPAGSGTSQVRENSRFQINRPGGTDR